MVTNESVSLTVMTKNFTELYLPRDVILKILIRWGLMEDIRTITPLGLKNGISYQSGKGGSKWPVYGPLVQQTISDRAAKIREMFPEEVAAYKLVVEATSKTAEPSQIDGDVKYKYLGLEDFVIMDTETTGLEDDDEIVELSIVSSDGKELYHSYYIPSKEVNPGASRVNHLTLDILKKKTSVTLNDEEWQKILAIVKGKHVMGHNIPFDFRVLKQTLAKNSVDYSNEIADLEKVAYDTKTIAKKHIDSKSYSLNNLTTLIGITREEQHNSTDDCIMTLEFVNRLEDILVIKKEFNFIK